MAPQLYWGLHVCVNDLCPRRVSRKQVMSERPTSVSRRSVLQSVKKACQVRVSYKSVLQECQVRSVK